jgi:hypothetical protein
MDTCLQCAWIGVSLLTPDQRIHVPLDDAAFCSKHGMTEMNHSISTIARRLLKDMAIYQAKCRYSQAEVVDVALLVEVGAAWTLNSRVVSAPAL